MRVEGPQVGWTSPPVLASVAVAPLAVAWFVRVERRASQPLLPLRYFSRPGFTFAIVAQGILMAAYMGSFIVTPLLLQNVLDFSETKTGLVSIARPLAFSLAGPMAGDIIILSDFDSGYYFGNPHAGVHGGLHPAESRATLAIGWPEASAGDWHRAKAIIRDAIQVRCRQENGRLPSVTDMATALNALWQLHPQASSALRREIS